MTILRDYVNLISTSKKSDYNKIAELTKKLKQISIDYNIIFVTAKEKR